jgi:histidinol-phosphate/aromatic aminotransferase/cobyric acid decarboxylase-like protein/choline kinase
MQALMLAAGMGKRLGKYTNSHTKCMVQVCGKTLIEHAIDALLQANITRLIMVVGYCADTLVTFLNEHSCGMEIEFVYNNDFAVTNNIYSLYLAKEQLIRDDTILLESDLIFDPQLIQRLILLPQQDVVAVSPYQHWMHGTVTRLDEKGFISEFISGSDFQYSDISQYYKTINIYKFSKEFSERFYVPFLEAYLRAYGTNEYYEMVLKIIASIQNTGLTGLVISDLPWYEIDDVQDLDIAETIFSEPDMKLRKMELRYGGYWRFDSLRDFCYLVNPYFPSNDMIKQLQYFCHPLLTQYPSGMDVQRMLAGKMFHINEQHLLVGNGAAELINVLGRCITGRLGIYTPTFNEYVSCFNMCQLVKMSSEASEFRLSAKQIIEDIKAASVNSLLIINPDNPSGAFLKIEEMFTILEACKEEDIVCIVDESFADFAEEDLRYSLLSDEVIEKYPNLVVIKSISKSYGIPGIRLGVIATSSTELLHSMRKQMPIWNINSFAEFFLQNYELYAKEYRYACSRIAEQRNIMLQRLREMPYLCVYDSQANYIMCQLIGDSGFSSTQLAEQLLRDWNILIKDLSTKDGICGGNYFRVAVKNEEENTVLLTALISILCR